MTGAKVKHTIHLALEISREMKAEAKRQDRSLSWIIRCAWEISKGKIREIPSTPALEPKDPR